MRTLLPVAAVVILLNAAQNARGQSPRIEEFLDSLGSSLIATGKITGMVLAAGENGQPPVIKAFGLADIEHEVPMKPDASFEIGSVTKQFTTVAIMQLTESKILSLDDDFTKYISFNTAGRKILIRHLMTNTSGIPDYATMPWMARLRKEEHPRDTLLRLIEKEALVFEPGEEVRYSSTNFFLLGLIIEKLTKMTYEEFVRRNLFGPADMTSSFYCSENKVRKGRAHGYVLSGTEFVRSGFFLRQWPYSAGALCSTAADLLKWNHALHATRKLLNAESYTNLVRCGVLMDGTVTRYASGMVSAKRNAQRLFMHSGGIDGFLTENRYFPDVGLSIVVLMNSTGGGSPIRIADMITNLVFPLRTSGFEDHQPDQTFAGIYQGTSRSGGKAEVSITDGEMSITVGDRERRPLLISSGTTYTDPAGLFLYTFKKTADGVELRIDEAYFNYLLKKI